MTAFALNHWQQWDVQEQRRLKLIALAEKLVAQTAAYIELNNLYLRLERGDERLTIHTGNTMRLLVDRAYDKDDEIMRDYWLEQFTRLPGWLDV